MEQKFEHRNEILMNYIARIISFDATAKQLLEDIRLNDNIKTIKKLEKKLAKFEMKLYLLKWKLHEIRKTIRLRRRNGHGC